MFHSVKHTVPVVVIGGGASGLMASIIAARHGASVTLLERQDRVGRKLLATGNGRCNLTNVHCTPSHFQGEDPSFAAAALKRFGVEPTLTFFRELGLRTQVEDEGKVFPLCAQASGVLDVLRFEAQRLGVQVVTECAVSSISRKGNSLRIACSSGPIDAVRIVAAFGGKAAPHLGGHDSGLAVMAKLGHRASRLFAALVPLKTGNPYARQLKGLKVIAGVKLRTDGRVVQEQIGEVLFTEYGLSGPPIIQLSQRAGRALLGDAPVSLTLDTIPSMSKREIVEDIRARADSRPEYSLETAFTGLAHKRLIAIALRLAGFDDLRKPVGELGPAEQLRVAEVFKEWTMAVDGALTWRDAQLMGGGVLTCDFVAESCASRLVPGLYAAGELLDIAGDCGGYNLQWAWSSGYVAGAHAAKP